MATIDRSLSQFLASIRGWSALRWVVAATVTLLTALLIGIPTGIVGTSFYTRMTPVLWWNYPIWAVSSLLTGLVAATYIRTGASAGLTEARFSAGGSVLSLLAVGCPICNKLVVLAVGTTGAMNLWAPVQPVLGVMSLTLLLWAFTRRTRGEVACSIPNRS